MSGEPGAPSTVEGSKGDDCLLFIPIGFLGSPPIPPLKGGRGRGKKGRYGLERTLRGFRGAEEGPHRR